MTQDSEAYIARKRQFEQMLTIYGRKTVLEALQMNDIQAHKLHLSSRNKPAAILNDIIAKARSKGAEIVEHDPAKLSRISKNAKQDQGVALDIQPSGFQALSATSFDANEQAEYIALDRITNPQNLGMIIRSVCASPIKGLIIPNKGCAKLDALVIKASAGTLFRTPIIRCNTLDDALTAAQQAGYPIFGLDLSASTTLSALGPKPKAVFVLGNESEGISPAVQAMCTERIKIPMYNRVESLNVAITASIIALRHQI